MSMCFDRQQFVNNYLILVSSCIDIFATRMELFSIQYRMPSFIVLAEINISEETISLRSSEQRLSPLHEILAASLLELKP